MATRKVSTKLAIEGESEYRASLSRINTELKTLQSALKLTESQYQTNANSMTALKAKGEALNNLYTAQKNKVQELRNALENAKSAEQRYSQQKAEIQAKIEANNKALEKLKSTTGDTTKEEERLNAENAELQKQLGEVDAKLQAAEKGTNNWQTQLNNAEIQLNNLDAEIQKNDKYLQEAEKSTDGCATSIDEFGKQVSETNETLQDMGTLLASAEFQEFADKVKDALMDCVRASMEFEVGMAGVKRTTGITGQDLDELGKYFKNLSTEIPITTQELTSIATTAGQLGVKGSDNVRAFTEVMAKLATTTDLTADTAATMLAQFSNITGVRDYERLGAVVASLGDATATTATKVVEMSQGIAATGNLAGMSATDIMAISAAVGSLGIESAAGSTAMSTLISTLYKATQTGNKLEEFASVAGMSAAQFKRAWETDAVGTLNAFIQGLNDTERNGKSAIVILDELGITNVRQTKAILGLASAEGLLTSTIEQANTAWDQNSALNEKAGIMYDTLQSKVTMLENATNNLKMSVGDALAPQFGFLVEAGTGAVKFFTDLSEKAPELTTILADTGGAIVGITSAVVGLQAASKAASFLGFTNAAAKMTGAVNGATGAIGAFVTAMGGVAPAAAVVATAFAGVYAIADTIRQTKVEGFLGEGHTLEEYAANVEAYRQKIVDLEEEQRMLAESGADLTSNMNALDMAHIGLAHATEELAAAEEAAAQATEDATAATDEYATAEERAAAAAEEITFALDEIAQAYQKSYEECRKSLEGQIGLFDDYAASISEDTDTAAELMERWSEQTANLASYTENLKKAGEYGLDYGLVRSLSDGSKDSAGYLAVIIGEIENAGNGMSAFAGSSEEAVARFNEAFEGTAEAKENLAATMAAIETGVQESIAAIEEQAAAVNFDGFYDAVDNAFANVGVDFSAIGGNMGEGLSSGISASTGTVTSAATSLVEETNNAARTAAGVHSPSTVWEEIGSNLDEGLAGGISKNAGTVIASVDDLSSRLNSTMEKAGVESAKGFIKGFKEIQSQTRTELEALKSVLNTGTYGMSDQMYGIGVNIVGGMINGIYSQSGFLYQAVYDVTSNAINAARLAADTHSPSKKTEKIFGDVGEGMAVGIEGKRERVAAATQKVVDKALRVDTSGIEKTARLLKISAPDMSALFSSNRHAPSAQPLKEGDIYVTFEHVEIANDMDIHDVAVKLGQEVQLEKRMKGQKL